MNVSSMGRTGFTALLVCAGCHVGASIGTWLRFPQIDTAILFPPYAVLTTALLLSPPRHWWIYLLASSVGNFWPHRLAGASTSFVLMTECANYARALVAASGIRRFGDARGRFDTLRGMAVFLLFAGLVAPVIAAFMGAGAVVLHQHRAEDFWLSWRAWLLSNTLTGLALLPIILTGFTQAASLTRRFSWRRLMEAGVLTFALLAVGGLVLLGATTPEDTGFMLLYAPLPLLLWAAVRFGPEGTCASLLLVGVLVIWGTLGGRGPFVTPSPADDIIHLQLFLILISVPLLLLSGLMQERQRTAETLRASEQQYHTVVNDQTELICRFLPDGTLTFVNEACCRSSGRSSGDLLGSSFWSLVPGERHEAEREIIAGLSPASPVATWEVEFTANAGHSRREQWTVRVFFDDRGRPLDYQAVGRDITGRKQAEEQQRLLEAQRTLAEVLTETDRRKDDLLAMLAHELRDPQGPMTKAVDALDQRPASDEQQTWARDIIRTEVAQLARLVDDVLDVSRISSGTTQLRLEAIDLEQVIVNAIETCQPLMTPRQIKVVTAMPPGPLLVRGDAARLVQLVANLLSNAARFSDAGGCIGVTTSLDSGQAVLRIKDTGAGMPRELLDRVFEPVTLADRLRDGALAGLGLGLTLVKHLVQLHNGTVTAHSDGPGLGSEFVVRLPAAKAAAAPRDPESKAPSEPAAPPPARQVLVVDAAVETAESLARLLTPQGHTVLVAHDGLAGLDTALRIEPEIVFLDLGLPRMDGLEVARLLRGRFGPERMLLVATTPAGQPADRRRIQEAGFDHHLTKPLDPSEVQALLAAGVRA